MVLPFLVGTGEATEALLGAIDKSGIANVYERLDASRWPDVTAAWNAIDEAISAAKNLPLREDLMKLRRIVSEGGLSGVRDYVQKYGSVGLPALAGLALLPKLLPPQPESSPEFPAL